MGLNFRLLGPAFWLVGGSCLLGATALAQSTSVDVPTASTLTDDDFTPQTRPLRGSLDFGGGGGLQAPPGSDQLTILIADVVVEGGRAEMAAAEASVRAQLTAGRVLVSDIFEAASALEAAYVEAGLILARVVIPQQSLDDGGTLTLNVVDGFVENIETDAVDPVVRARIAELTAPLEGRPGLTQDEIERRLLLAGDTYGVALGSALSTGATPGGTVLILDGKFRKLTGFVTVDNYSSDPLGTWSAEAGLEFNSALGLGEVIYGRLSGAPDGDFFASEPQQRTFVLGAVIPIQNDGLSFGFEAASTRTNPEDVVLTRSSFERQSIRLSYPWIRTLDTNLTVQAALDFQRDELSVLPGSGGELLQYREETRVLRFSGDYFRVNADNSVMELGGTLSFGLDSLGADAVAPTADLEFTKLELSARYRRPLGERLSLALAGRIQTSFGDPLVQAEQFGIATAQELSAFDQGAITGDEGWVVRADISYPIETTIAELPARVSPYVYAAHGEVRSEGAGTVDASSLGIGVEVIQLRDPDFSTGSLRVEVGQGTRSDGGSDGTRVSVVGSYRF